MTRAANPDLAANILTEAERIVVSSGHEAHNMRQLASRVGVSATAIYRYFESRDQILRKLRIKAAEMLNDRIRAIGAGLSPHEFLGELGRQYLLYAQENPQMYRLLFEAPFDERAESEDHPVLYFTYLAARGAIEKLAKPGVAIADPRSQAMMGWIMLHGFCSLMMSGLLPIAEGMSKETLQELFLGFYTQGK
jgi:AcrR family transcriptional regulator